MKMNELLMAQLETEVPITRRVLERVPEGRDNWKPHDKSMPLGKLATLVASMPSWVVTMVNQDELELNPPGGSSYRPQELRSKREWVEALEGHASKARESLAKTTDEHLMKKWRLLVGGRVVGEDPRYRAILTTFNHLAHHRGQLTVYLRLNNVAVPPVYGPTADEEWK
jgi:uncharacterized damage-inducible protein DinB